MAGLIEEEAAQTDLKLKDKSVIKGYRMTDYKEQPHTNAEKRE